MDNKKSKNRKEIKKSKKRMLSYSNVNYERDLLQKKKLLSSFFDSSNYIPMTKKQIMKALKIKESESYNVFSALLELELDGQITENKANKYEVINNELIECIFDCKGSFGFAIRKDGKKDDIYIPNGYINSAMNKDTILVKEYGSKGYGNNRATGKIMNVTKRAITTVIGEVYKSNKKYYLLPLDSKIQNIYITNIDEFEEVDKLKKCIVNLNITKYPTDKNGLEGIITKVVGSKDATKTYVEALYYANGLDSLENFDNEVLKELDNISDIVNKEDLINRVDRTKENVFTIDSYEAKDLDDAISVKKNNDGSYILSVYIADVSHYVKEGTSLDKEALKRATSIYIPGSVLPMLPKKLSNGICSLSENELRLVLAIDIYIDKNGNVFDENVFKGYIKSKKKMTYENVYKALEDIDKNVVEEYKEFLPDLKIMKEIANKLNNKRFQEGGINFDIPETKVVLDNDNNVIDIKTYPSNYANNMIEECMLVANRVIAKKYLSLKVPFMYRIHEIPDEEKLKSLNVILNQYNKKLKSVKNVTSKMIQEVMKDFSSEEEKHILSTITLRTLKLAKYSDECLGHFGLGFKYYCHFTSPIRRYPDLFIHRVISECLEKNNKLGESKSLKYEQEAKTYSLISSEQERKSTLIERDFNDLYMAIYMSDKIGEKFEGRISSVTSFGMFVKLDNTIEGLVHISKLKGYYVFDDKNYTLCYGKKVFKIGDKVKVKLDSVDIKLKDVNFSLYK